MPSMRRMRLFGAVVFCVVFYVLYLTSNARHTGSQDFYSKTKEALDRERGPHHPHAPHRGVAIDSNDEEVAINLENQLKDAAQAAKSDADSKLQRLKSADSTGRKATPVVQDIITEHGAADKKEETAHKDESAEDYDVEQEMNRLLKRSPIIIFSKTYCPHSKRAKDILLKKYTIVPSPFVVELDNHPKGTLLQEKLAEMTNRKTVPNVLVTGKSIGGGDDVAELDQTKKLIDKIKSLGGKQIQKIQEAS